MLSVLIPTYNYNIHALVNDLHEQLMPSHIDFEICVYDDASVKFKEKNSAISSLSNTTYVYLDENVGRSAIRNKLALEAKYDWLLFLDADVSIISQDFIQKYIAFLKNPSFNVIYGGISYAKESPNASTHLRWYYGKKREAISSKKRRKSPYNIISQNLLIKKYLFLKSNIFFENLYGLDIIFSNELRKSNASILHIENNIRHDGLESNADFLSKSLKAVETTIFFEKKGIITKDCRSLQRVYATLKKMGLLKPTIVLTQFFLSQIERNLIGKSPSIFLFDLYRLNHYAKLK